ncbi:hypothetical protein SLS62_000915 [Diatrype stigma]|uniref:Amidohydrolase-related domain-containing protein n=1 Tax=Diatrype stigma TaxID=117547 RepID=A0AAN9V9A1_9PEZI
MKALCSIALILGSISTAAALPHLLNRRHTPPPQPPPPLRLPQHRGFITLEEHWTSPAILSVSDTNPLLPYTQSRSATLAPALRDLGALRLASMAEGDIDVQVISVALAPSALLSPSVARASNDQLAAAIAANTPSPSRFRAWAFLPMADPAAAARELERAVRELGFVGALVDSRLDNGSFYDGAAYAVFWAKAQELGAPVYLHPTVPPGDSYGGGVPAASVFAIDRGRYAPSSGSSSGSSGGPPETPDGYSYPLSAAVALATNAWGWHVDVGLHFLRLYAAGVFEAFPRLKIVLGHMGEAVPFMLERADGILPAPLLPDIEGDDRRTTAAHPATLLEVYARNVWITTSGFFSLNTMATVLRNTAVDRIMYSVDYPYSSNTRGKQFMEELRDSGLVSESEWLAIARGNAEELLGL